MKYTRCLLIVAIAVSIGAAATIEKSKDLQAWEKAKKTYVAHLSSENAGVKASAANFVRKYHIVEAKTALKEILFCDNCETVKVSAALALLEIAGEEGEEAIRKALVTEENDLVSAFYKAILHSEAETDGSPVSTR